MRMWIFRRSARTLTSFLVLAIFLSAFPLMIRAQSAASGNRRVLVIYSYSRHLPWSEKLIAGLEEVLDSVAVADRPALFEESLDSNLLGNLKSPELWAAYLSEKYRTVSLDAVITESQQAAEIFLAFPDLFPGIPRYIFNTLPSDKIGEAKGLERRYSSVSDLETALRTIFHLIPETRRVVVVADRSAIGKTRTAFIRSLASRFPNATIDIRDDFTKPELLDMARGLSGDAVLFCLPVLFDKNNQVLVPATIAAELSEVASVPVFSHFDTLIGTGIVGGYSVSAVQLGRLIGRIALFGSSSAPADQAGYAKATMGYWFDARALARWKIRETLLPENSAVLFRTQTFLQRYWMILLGTLLLFGLETFLVIGLARSSARSKRFMVQLNIERASLENKVLSRTSDLAKVNAELATLFKELQHRVKNNLAIIVSLVNIETDRVQTDEAKDALRTLGSRIMALASLYDILYATGRFGEIELSEYLERVVQSITSTMGADMKGITVVRHLSSLTMDMKRAVALGLIVNELVTDSFKYGFPYGAPGTIWIRLTMNSGTCILEIQDDGTGLPPGFDPKSSEGFGLKLVGILAEQLSATFTVTSDEGARFTLSFPFEIVD